MWGSDPELKGRAPVVLKASLAPDRTMRTSTWTPMDGM